jgi:hypothetical protein
VNAGGPEREHLGSQEGYLRQCGLLRTLEDEPDAEGDPEGNLAFSARRAALANAPVNAALTPVA